MKQWKLLVEFEVTEWNKDALLQFLATMKWCASVGASREIPYYCDGDGNPPQIKSVSVSGIDLTRQLNEFLPSKEDLKKLS